MIVLVVIEWYIIYVNKIYLTNIFWIFKINFNNNLLSISFIIGVCVINIKLLYMILKWIKILDIYMVVMVKFLYVGIGILSVWFL